jgi:hypothetical protein
MQMATRKFTTPKNSRSAGVPARPESSADGSIMSAIIIPFRNSPIDCEPAPAERLAARRIYRAGCKALSAEAIGHAFSMACKLPSAGPTGLDDALAIFVAAMRRELRESGMLPRPRSHDRQAAPAVTP